jgi:hypothetical protein
MLARKQQRLQRQQQQRQQLAVVLQTCRWMQHLLQQ